MKWLRVAERWFRLIFEPRPRYRVLFVEEFPDDLVNDAVYLAGDVAAPWAAAFLCPCGCREVVSLSLIKRDKPSWRATISSANRVTLSPSIWRVKACKSHFFIRDGRVIWATAAGERRGGC